MADPQRTIPRATLVGTLVVAVIYIAIVVIGMLLVPQATLAASDAPFVILVMTPFIEQIDMNLESAARVFGASTPRMFWHVLVPLLAPGILGKRT